MGGNLIGSHAIDAQLLLSLAGGGFRMIVLFGCHDAWGWVTTISSAMRGARS